MLFRVNSRTFWKEINWVLYWIVKLMQTKKKQIFKKINFKDPQLIKLFSKLKIELFFNFFSRYKILKVSVKKDCFYFVNLWLFNASKMFLSRREVCMFLQAAHDFPNIKVGSAEIRLLAKIPFFGSICCPSTSAHGRISLVPKGEWKNHGLIPYF